MPGPFHPLHFPIVFWGVALESTVCLSPCSQPHPPGSSLTDNYAPLPPSSRGRGLSSMPHVLELHTPNYTVVHRLHAPLHIVSKSCSYVEIPGIRSPHAAVLLPPHIWEHLPGVTYTDPPWSHHHAVWHTGGTSALPHAHSHAGWRTPVP